MSTQQYLDTGRDHQHGHAGPELTLSSKSPSTVGAYASQEYSTQTPYSAVSSFNLPASCDSSLLTPVSNSPSPPMQNRTPKAMRRYHPSPPGISQQPSPPPTTNPPLWPSQVPSSMSQASSPMSVQAHSADGSFSMLPFMRNEVTPTSITPFLGHYTVSENTSADQSPTSMHHFGHMYGSVGMTENPDVMVAPPASMVLQTMMNQQQQQQRQQQLRHMVDAPILTQPNPQHLRARQNSMNQHHGQQQHQLPRGISDDGRVSKRQQPRTKVGVRRASRQTAAAAAEAALEYQHLRSATDKKPPASRGSTSSSKSDAPLPKLELADDCPEKLKYLLDLRYRFQDNKGKGMWETIHLRWGERYEPKAKEALQMDVNRAVYKYGIWPQSEDEALLEAYRLDEENKMARITAHMKELGGGRYWDWKEKNVMKRLHELGVEEIVVEPSTGTISRRKRKVRRDDGGGEEQQTAPLMEGWSQPGVGGGHSNGNHQQHQHQLVGSGITGPASASSEQKLALELESELFETLVKGEPRESPVSGGGAAEKHQHQRHQHHHQHQQQKELRQRAPSTAASPSESERLARQVCAQIMQEQHREHAGQQ